VFWAYTKNYTKSKIACKNDLALKRAGEETVGMDIVAPKHR